MAKSRKAAANRRDKRRAVYRLPSDYQLAEYYDLRTRHITRDVDFYADFFAHATTTVLELGCGTGRILEGLARRGHRRLIGIDKCSQMLKLARAKLPQNAVQLHQCDVACPLSTTLRRRIAPVDAIVMGFNMFHEIRAIRRRQQCIKNCHALLAHGGRLVIDVCIPRFFREGTRRVREKKIAAFVDGKGRFVECFISLRADFVHQTLAGRATYRVFTAENGRFLREYQSPVRSAFTKPSEFMLLADLGGFSVRQQWGGYDRSPYRPTSERQIVILEKA